MGELGVVGYTFYTFRRVTGGKFCEGLVALCRVIFFRKVFIVFIRFGLVGVWVFFLFEGSDIDSVVIFSFRFYDCRLVVILFLGICYFGVFVWSLSWVR